MGINYTHITKRTFRQAFIFAGLASLLLSTTALSSCHKELDPTDVEVEDPIRHYPPITLGDELVMVYMVKNVGEETLVITDVQPSCPAIDVSAANTNIIPPGESAPMKFTFHSDKNIGLARHCIRMFGNINPSGMAEIVFDTHVVRPSVDLSDYEEHYQKNLQSTVERHLDDEYSRQQYTTEQK